MRLLASLILLVVGPIGAFAAQSDVPEPIRITVRSADPYFIKSMLEGRESPFPEMSTIWGVLGMPANTSATVGTQIFQNGHLVVNPTDNSLWFFPDRPKK